MNFRQKFISIYCKNRYLKCVLVIFFCSTTDRFGYRLKVHQNLPEEGLLYMEIQGSNQMRWAADYLKAKAQGRYTGKCVNLGGAAAGMPSNIQCGAIGINRVGGDKPDYVQDVFADHSILPFDWNSFGNNFTSYTHFINLKRWDASGNAHITNNYNFFDGYSYNTTYGFGELGIDMLLAVGLNNAQFSIDPQNCTDSKCSEYLSIATGINVNPVIDYQQNGSTTPVGYPRGTKRLGSDDGTNYNCSSDTAIIGPCPDVGATHQGVFQYPNVQPGGGMKLQSIITGDEDWVIWEPSYNAATFYYNEGWLEGFSSRNHHLQTLPIVGRYYNVTGNEILYFALTHHYTGDIVQMSHVWVTSGYNHADIEAWAENYYGEREIGGADPIYNLEDYFNSQAYVNSRQNRYQLAAGNVHRLILEQAFYTYHLRFRAGYDKMTTTDTGIWRNVVTWAVQNATATMALVNEKAVLDLRKCRNFSTCDNR